MANHAAYLELIPIEAAIRIGQLIHLYQNDEKLFAIMEDVRHLGIAKGAFDKVKFGNEAFINEQKDDYNVGE